MISKLKYIIGRETDPYRNIALEKYLTLHAAEGECVLFLWQNQRTVVIGRNQNAWEECRIKALQEDGGRLARRLSGGGAVYHDLGNLNFSFAVRKADYDTARQSEVILRAVRMLGIPAERTGRNDFEAGGRKFSGNAFYDMKGCCCHHGTIMLNVDTDAMERYLNIAPAKLHSKGVSSVHARVLNLKEFFPDIRAETLNKKLLEAFGEVYAVPCEALTLNRQAEEEIQKEAENLASESWLFPPRIPFTAEMNRRFSWGGLRICLNVKQNRVAAADCWSDAMDEQFIRGIQEAITGCRYDGNALSARVIKAADTVLRQQMAAEIADMIREQFSEYTESGAVRKEYDLIVIGAGPGGYEAAFEAADLGMKTALIEKENLGGTCLNHGCIPTKSLLHAAELYRQMREAAVFGVTAEAISYDPLKMQERKREAVDQLRKGIEAAAKKKKVDILRGVGTVCGEGQVNVRTEGGDELLRAQNILIATGSHPAMPPIPGADLPGVVTSDELLEWGKKIEKLVIIGGGVIGVEFASLYQALGTEVTVIEAMPQLLPNLDRELGQSVKMLLKKRGVTVCTGAKVEAIRPGESGGLLCDFSTGKTETVQADVVLVCVGRRPYTEGLFSGNVRPDMERGRILVNDRYETSLPHVYAIGDVTGGIMLAHAATASGRNAARFMAGMPPFSDTRFIPSCVYTEPEIACVGLTLDEAKAAGLDADSQKAVMTANGKTVLTGAERGYIRVVFEKQTGRLLGAQLMCERATDIISGFTQALSAGMTVSALSKVIRPHPTFSEAITDAVRQ